MKRILLMTLVALMVAACGPTQVVVVQPTPTAVPCTRALYVEALGNITTRWDDANALANNTSRMSLAPQIGALQGIRREAEELNIPDCATVAHSHLIEYMNQIINGFMAFMGQATDGVVNNYFRDASVAFDQWTQSMDQLPTDADPGVTG